MTGHLWSYLFIGHNSQSRDGLIYVYTMTLLTSMCSDSSRIPIAVLPRLYNRERGSVAQSLVAHPCEKYFTLRQLLCTHLPDFKYFLTKPLRVYCHHDGRVAHTLPVPCACATQSIQLYLLQVYACMQSRPPT